MLKGLSIEKPKEAIRLLPVDRKSLMKWCAENQDYSDWVAFHGFKAEKNQLLTLYSPSESVSEILVGVEGVTSLWSLAYAAENLPPHAYVVEDRYNCLKVKMAAIGWALACYQFDLYKSPKPFPLLHILEEEFAYAFPLANATCMVRDWVNTPAEDMNPDTVSAMVKTLGSAFGATVSETVGEDLLEENFPAIHAVGRAAAFEPRLIHLTWGDLKHPQIALVGKGVCFDTGGLDIKPSEGMRLMKKDMGGMAHVLGLAYLIMTYRLPVCLNVYLPVVENSISSNAYRPGDVVRTRQGLNIEVGNTDAEGRLILADALTLASESNPELILDFATLTGAARVALGPSVPALFVNDDELADKIYQAAINEEDLVWRLPLHDPYSAYLKSNIADLRNDPSIPYGGSITAALFLENFIGEQIKWCHFDLMAWNLKSLPGRPEGGEAQALRAVFAFLLQQYGIN